MSGIEVLKPPGRSMNRNKYGAEAFSMAFVYFLTL
jgi:hypothetical protein